MNRKIESQVNGVLRGRWFYDPAGNLGALWDLRHYRPRNAADADLGTTYQRTYYDSWGRVTQQQTLVPQPDGNGQNMFRFRTVYTLRDDGQPSTVSHPSSNWYGYDYKVDYGYNSRTGAAETLAEQSGSGLNRREWCWSDLGIDQSCLVRQGADVGELSLPASIPRVGQLRRWLWRGLAIHRWN